MIDFLSLAWGLIVGLMLAVAIGAYFGLTILILGKVLEIGEKWLPPSTSDALFVAAYALLFVFPFAVFILMRVG